MWSSSMGLNSASDIMTKSPFWCKISVFIARNLSLSELKFKLPLFQVTTLKYLLVFTSFLYSRFQLIILISLFHFRRLIFLILLIFILRMILDKYNVIQSYEFLIMLLFCAMPWSILMLIMMAIILMIMNFLLSE